VIVPNFQTTTVNLRRLLESPVFQQKEGLLKVGLGVDTFDQPVVLVLATLPHLLIGGTTGSGKSVCLNGMIASLLCTYPPAVVRLVLIDPLQVELKHYEGVPHLLVPVTTNADQVLNVLASLNTEIARRFTDFSKRGVREIKTYNQQAAALDQELMPYLVIFVDNLTDLMLTQPREIEQGLSRIAAMGRGAGVHLVIATQRSNVDVVSGAIKANASGRIAFRVVDSADSRLILDTSGAEDLLGPGDMLYKTPDVPLPRRAQGVYVTESELGRIVRFWRGK
jgi:S-DNA-T family DNA segregation ATPase FtsK/SpoIIIE